MKMVKSLLLGSAAGLVAIAGAQAADLPVKAKAVEYVKVCSLYGAGFYYIPGTDTCLKLGGFLRAEADINAGGSFNPAAVFAGANSQNTRTKDQFYYRTRVGVSLDVRTQTEYGTLRSYSQVWNTINSANVGPDGAAFVQIPRAFIQFAGFTAGMTQSFYDFFIPASNHSWMVYGNTTVGAHVTNGGSMALAYTAQFGNGLSASLSLEDPTPRRSPVVNASTTAYFAAGGGVLGSSQTGLRYPDLVGSIDLRQAWGSAHLAGALHDASGAYYTPGTIGSGSPGDKTGYAVTGGVTVNLPWAKGDTFGIQASWGKGANAYVNGTRTAQKYSGSGFGYAQSLDGVYTTGSSVTLTEAWSVVAGLEHRWTPAVRTSLYGGYTGVNYNATATAALCATSAFVTALPATCNPDYNVWSVGSRTVWNPVANLDLSLELLYTKLDQKMVGTYTLAANGSRPAGAYTAADQNNFSVQVRAQRNFWP